MNKLQSTLTAVGAVSIVALTSPYTATTALSLTHPTQQRVIIGAHHTHHHRTTLRRPSFVLSSRNSVLHAVKEKDAEPFFVEDEEAQNGKSWPVKPPTTDPPQSDTDNNIIPTPPKPVISNNDGPSAFDKFLASTIYPLLNPSIAKNVPSTMIQGAFLSGALLTFTTSFLLFGPLSISSLLTVVLAANVGVITSYISITDSDAGQFVRSLGSATMEVTDSIMNQINELQGETKKKKVRVAELKGSVTKTKAKVVTLQTKKTKAKVEELKAKVESKKSIKKKKRINVEEEEPMPLTEGMTAEEAEEIRSARVLGDGGMKAADELMLGTAGTDIIEGQTGEEAETARMARLSAADLEAEEKKAELEEEKKKKKAEEEAAAAAAVAEKKKTR